MSMTILVHRYRYNNRNENVCIKNDDVISCKHYKYLIKYKID